MAHIDYFFGVFSAYVYLAGTRLEGIAARHGATIAYKPLDLGALFARTGGLPNQERHETRRAYRLQEMRRQAAKAGLPLNLHPRHFPTNPAPASYAIIAAGKAGGGDMGALIHALGRACWAEERDIADDGVIRDCLSGAGFDPDVADRGMLASAETYSANLEEAVAKGAFGSPFYVVDTGELFWGQDRLADLELHMEGKL
jgi:2-hydroxychromene-2-carboxylate isomerase